MDALFDLTVHPVNTLTFAVFIYLQFANYGYVLGVILAGIFINLDHCIDYFLALRAFNKIRRNSPRLAAGMNGVFCREELALKRYAKRKVLFLPRVSGKMRSIFLYEDTLRLAAG